MAIVIAGNPRSGTSLTMNISAEAVGMARIIGKKFGKLERFDELHKQGEGESDAHYKSRMYNLARDPKYQTEKLEHYVDMNPKGFFEHGQFTVNGIRYLPNCKDDIKQLDEEDKTNPYVIKLVNSGLFLSDPRYVDKVIYLIRHPWDIAKSQIDLNREKRLRLNSGLEVDVMEGVEFEDCGFFLSATIHFSMWRVEHPEVPVLFVHFDDLIADPKTQLRRMADFAGIPEYMKGMDIIDQRLGTRHKVEHDKREGIWQEALNVHNLFCEERFQEIVDFSDVNDSYYRKSNLRFKCPRLRAPVHYENCLFCRSGKKEAEDFIWSGISRNMINGWDWEGEPCLFECGFDPDDKNPKTIQESIASNHWLPIQNSIIKKRPEFTPVI